MWDVIWFLGFPMFAVGVFGAPYKKHYDYDRDGFYSSDNYDVVYDQRQNGTENYKFSVDGLSLIWSPNSLLAAAALLEPALYGEYPDTSVDVILGPDLTTPDQKPILKPPPEKPAEEQPPEKETGSKTSSSAERPSQTILVISDDNQTSEQKPGSTDQETHTRRKLRIPGILRPFLRKRSSVSALPVKVFNQEK